MEAMGKTKLQVLDECRERGAEISRLAYASMNSFNRIR